jgi:hypothetical protein
MGKRGNDGIREQIILASAVLIPFPPGLAGLVFVKAVFSRVWGLAPTAPVPNSAMPVLFLSMAIFGFLGLLIGMVLWITAMNWFLTEDEKQYYYDSLSQVPVITRLYRKACRRIWKVERFH